MTPEQMRAKSAEKVKQVMDLMTSLNLKVEARERIDEGGFIEKLVFWIDNEKYPSPEVESIVAISKKPATEGAQGEIVRAHKFVGSRGEEQNAVIDAWKNPIVAELGLAEDQYQIVFMTPAMAEQLGVKTDNA